MKRNSILPMKIGGIVTKNSCIKIAIVPLCIGVVIRIIFLLLGIDKVYIDRIEFVLNAIITFSSALTGFILTSLSILIGLSNSPIMVELKKRNALPELRWRFSTILLNSIFSVIFCLVLGMVINETKQVDSIWFTISIIMMTSFLSTTIINGWYLWQ